MPQHYIHFSLYLMLCANELICSCRCWESSGSWNQFEVYRRNKLTWASHRLGNCHWIRTLNHFLPLLCLLSSHLHLLIHRLHLLCHLLPLILVIFFVAFLIFIFFIFFIVFVIFFSAVFFYSYCVCLCLCFIGSLQTNFTVSFQTVCCKVKHFSCLFSSKSDPTPKPGDLIEITRVAYQHWAVYVGDGYIVHVTLPPGGESSVWTAAL